MSRRFPGLILAGATTLAVVMAVVGCTANTDSSTLDNDTTADSSAAGTISIVDHTGNEISIPSDIQRVAFDEIPLASTYVAYQEGSAPHLVGMSDAVVRSLENTVVVVMNTHYPSHALRIADTALLLNAHHEPRHGPTDEVITIDHMREVFGVDVHLARIEIDGRSYQSVLPLRVAAQTDR